MKQLIYTKEALNEISFPLGGIGTGSIGLAGNGRLIDWEIFGHASKGSDNGYSHFAVKAEKNGIPVDTRILNGDITKDYSGTTGRGFGYGIRNTTMAGFPHFRDCTFRGEYPVAVLDFFTPEFPGTVQMTAFNPLIPLNAEDSGIPAAFFSYSVTNTTGDTLDYTVSAVLCNPNKNTVNRFSAEDGMTGIFLDSTDNTPDGFDSHDLTIAAPDTENVAAQEYWYRGRWFDGLETYWSNFREPGFPKPRSYETPGSNDYGVLYVRKTAKPGETVTFRFVIAWNTPNRRNDWDRYTEKNEAGEEVEIPLKNHYATVFENSFASARYALREWDRLYGETMKYHDALFSSTVPKEVLDAVSATTSVLKTETCWRLGEKGDFYGWEGLNEQGGSCAGTCTHVWNYAYAMCYLFPDLERNIRENDFRYNQRPDGDMCFRTRIPFGRGVGTFRACADGQLGGVMKVYRDWKFCGDDEWLRPLWPAVKRSLAYAWSEKNFDRWDRDHDGVLEGRQHHTLDMELFGPSSWLEGFYLGALRASAEMARAMGDDAFADECGELFTRGKKWSDENLFNGKYFMQKLDLHDKAMLETYTEGECVFGGNAVDNYWNGEAGELKYQIGDGCIIDQMLAQWHADLSGLGDIYDPEKVRTALSNLFKNNFKESMREHFNTFRLFAVNDEAGTIICTYPDEKTRPVIPIPYSTESMHGFEYAFAGLLISRGYIEEGLRVVRAVRDRYDGVKRNPWNELECGSNYARSMASYALLPLLSGMTADMRRGLLCFAPKIERENFRCVFSVGGAWGVFSVTGDTAEIRILGGVLRLAALRIADFENIQCVTADGQETPFSVKGGEIDLGGKIAIRSGVTVKRLHR